MSEKTTKFQTGDEALYYGQRIIVVEVTEPKYKLVYKTGGGTSPLQVYESELVKVDSE